LTVAEPDRPSSTSQELLGGRAAGAFALRTIPLAAFAFLLTLQGCSDDSTPSGTKTADDAARGRAVYLSQCTACHASDPAKNGPLGPAIKGSSRALLEAKVLRGSYPPGYRPKRNTAVMPPQPQLTPAIPDLDAFLR